MSLTGKITTAVLFVLLPVMAGGVWQPFVSKNIKLQTTDVCKLLIRAWICGMITMFAVMQLIAVPMIARRMSFSLLVNVWLVCVIIIAVSGTVCHVICVRTAQAAAKNADAAGKYESIQMNADDAIKKAHSRHVVWVALLAAVFAGLVAYQARFVSKYQHTDDDDARFISLELLAVDEDKMLTNNPIDGSPMYWNVGEVKKDYISPWTMYVAACSRISNVHPAILSHRLMPMYLIPLCYMAYFLLALNLFKDNAENSLIFCIIISAVNLFGYTSTHTVSSLMLLRIWQGKALFAGFIIPVLLDALYRLYDDCHDTAAKGWLFAVCTAASLMSGSGIVISALAVIFYGAVILLKFKDIKNTLTIWVTCSPCVVYALCNVFWYQVFKVS